MCGANVFALNEPDREPAYRAPNDRVLRVGRRGARPAVPVRAPEPRRGSARRGRALPRPRRARHQAAPARAGLPRQRSASSRRSSRWPTSGACRCSSTRAAACPPGMPLELGHVAERHPDASLILAHAAIVAQARHRQARAQRREHLLRQLDVDAARPAQPALAGAAGADPVGLGHPVRRAARRAQRVRALGARERRRRRPHARDAARQRARPARGPPPGAALGAARRPGVPHLVRARRGPPCIWPGRRRYSGSACRSTSDTWASRRPRCTRRASTSRPSSCAARARVWNAVGRDARARRAARPGRPRARVAAAQPGPGRHGARMSERHARAQRARVERERPRRRDARRGAARAGRPDGHEDRLRRGHLRRLHGARRRARRCSRASCSPPRPRAATVTTIEGLGDEGALSALQRAFVEEDALQCGFCTPGPGRLGDRAAGRDAAADERAGARRR